jgi:hypothetical protein
LRATLKAAEAKLKAFGAGLTGIGAGIVGLGAGALAPLLGAAKSFADAGSVLADASARTGVSVEALSALGHAAGQTGTDLETVEGGIKKMQKALGEAALGSSEAQVAFGELGLSVDKLLRLNPDQQFEAVAQAIGRIDNPTLKAAAAMKVFGKSGTALVPLIDDLDALTKEARDLGLVMSTEDAQSADRLGDAMDNVSATLNRVVQVVGAALAPDLSDLADQIIRVVSKAIEWVNANRPLIVTIAKVAAGVVVAGAALVGLGVAFSALGSVLGGVATGIGVVGAVLGAIFSPLGLITIGLAAGAVAFFKYTDAGQQALAFLSESFGQLWADATTTFKGIADALKAGDIGLAAQILWTGLKIEFLKGVQFLRALWADWGNAFMDVFQSASTFVSGLMIDLWAGIQSTWAASLSALKGSWGSALAEMLKIAIPFSDVLGRLLGVDVGKAIDDALGTGGGEAARKAALGDQLAGIESGRQGARKDLDAHQAAEAEARRQASAESLAAGATELSKAQEELAALVGQAASEAGGLGGGAKRPAGLTPDALDETLGQAKQKVDVAGGFSGNALRGLGAGQSVGNDQLKEQKKANDKLEKINKSVKESRAVFT